MYKLIIEDDEGKTTIVPLIRDEITIGRKEGNTIRLTERNVSRRHAKLSKSNGSVFIEDLQSSNGTFLNGMRLAPHTLAPISDRDALQIGPYVFALRLTDGAAEVASHESNLVVREKLSAINLSQSLYGQDPSHKLQVVLEIALGTVGGRKHDHVRFVIEAVHLGQQLVECLLAFVIRAETSGTAAPAANRIDLVDEDDRRGSLARLGEQVPHP